MDRQVFWPRLCAMSWFFAPRVLATAVEREKKNNGTIIDRNMSIQWLIVAMDSVT